MVVFLPHVSTTTAALFAISIFVIFLFLHRIPKSAKNRRQAPEAAGGWPILGHLHLLRGSELPHVTLGALADKYGPIFSIRLGMRPTIIVNSWEVAKECFTTNDIALSSRPKQIGGKYLGYGDANFGFSPYGPFWREMRKISALELLSNRRLELLKHIRAFEVESSIKELFNLWRNKSDEDSEGAKVLVEMKQWFGELNLNVILKMVVGKRYFGAGDEEEGRRCQKAMRDFFHLLGQFVAGDVIPFLGWLDLGGHEKAMKRVGKELDDIFSKWLDEHIQRRQTGQVTEEQDFMDVMMSILESSDLSGYDAHVVNKATCVSIVTGAADTTSVTLTWALALLLNHPHVLRKAQDELDLHVGRKRFVTESDINSLVYLQAIVKEVLRLYPAGRLTGPRESTKACILGGYHVPAGTRLTLNLWKIHTDPRVWSDPLKFEPERFLTAHKDVDVKGQHFELIPFGAGRRACPGMSFALQMIHLILASLLQAFEISTPTEVDMTESYGLTSAKATPLEVLIAPRLSPTMVIY